MPKRTVSATLEGLDQAEARAFLDQLTTALSQHPLSDSIIGWEGNDLTFTTSYEADENTNHEFMASMIGYRVKKAITGEADARAEAVFENIQRSFDHSRAARQLAPQRTDPILGTLYWNSQMNWWETRLPTPVDICFPGSQLSSESKTHIGFSYPVVQDLPNADAKCRAAVTRELLATYNDHWNDGPPIDAAKFGESISLSAIWFEQDGSYQVHYDDGELFLGHALVVCVNADRTVRQARMEG